VNCERHRRKRQRPPYVGDAYGRDYQANRETVLARAGCEPGTGIGGACELCGLPGTSDDPLEAGRIVPLVLGGGGEVENLRAVHHREHAHQPKRQKDPAVSRGSKGE
jgi:hypothetical protein